MQQDLQLREILLKYHVMDVTAPGGWLFMIKSELDVAIDSEVRMTREFYNRIQSASKGKVNL